MTTSVYHPPVRKMPTASTLLVAITAPVILGTNWTRTACVNVSHYRILDKPCFCKKYCVSNYLVQTISCYEFYFRFGALKNACL